MSFVGFLRTPVVVHVGCMATFYFVVENNGLLDLQAREFSDDLIGSREAQQVLL